MPIELLEKHYGHDACRAVKQRFLAHGITLEKKQGVRENNGRSECECGSRAIKPFESWFWCILKDTVCDISRNKNSRVDLTSFNKALSELFLTMVYLSWKKRTKFLTISCPNNFNDNMFYLFSPAETTFQIELLKHHLPLSVISFYYPSIKLTINFPNKSTGLKGLCNFQRAQSVIH